MPPAPQQTDTRREQLRRQAIERRQAVVDRIAAIRYLVVGGVIGVSCILAGYLDASAHTRTSGAVISNNSGLNNGFGPSQGQFGGGVAPSSSSGGGTVVSGGS